MATPTQDGFTSGTVTGTSIVLTLTTTLANDKIFIAFTATVAGRRISSISSANTTGWVRRAQGDSGPCAFDVWVGDAAAALSSEAITVNYSASSISSALAVGINGATGFDPDASIPAVNTGIGTAPNASANVDDADVLALLFTGGNDAAAPTADAAWTRITSVQGSTSRHTTADLKSYSGPTAVSGTLVGTDTNWVAVLDAVSGAPSIGAGSGTFSASGIGAGTAVADGAGSALVSASGVGLAAAEGAGSAAITTAAAAEGELPIGSAAAIFDALGVGQALAPAAGVAAMTATGTAEGTSSTAQPIRQAALTAVITG